MLESAHFSKGYNWPPTQPPPPPPPFLPPYAIRKYFLHILIYIFISCMQSHTHAFVQVSSAMLMSVDLVLNKSCFPRTYQ